jgi:hypothetical protein
VRRRIIVLSVLLTGLVGGGTVLTGSGATAAPTTTADGYWACVGSELLDKGICIRNPFPEQLPRVGVALPATPPA